MVPLRPSEEQARDKWPAVIGRRASSRGEGRLNNAGLGEEQLLRTSFVVLFVEAFQLQAAAPAAVRHFPELSSGVAGQRTQGQEL